MNQDLQTALAEFMQSIMSGSDFVLAQAPDVINQLLRWEFVISLCQFIGYFILALIFAFFMIKGTIKIFSTKTTLNFDDDGWLIVLPAIPLSLVMVGMFSCTAWIQILIAPKVFLLEYASNLIG